VEGFLRFSFHYYNKVVTSHLGGKIRNFSIIGKSFRIEIFLKIVTFKVSFPLNNFHIETNLR
jgi:hypothetical protein